MADPPRRLSRLGGKSGLPILKTTPNVEAVRKKGSSAGKVDLLPAVPTKLKKRKLPDNQGKLKKLQKARVTFVPPPEYVHKKTKATSVAVMPVFRQTPAQLQLTDQLTAVLFVFFPSFTFLPSSLSLSSVVFIVICIFHCIPFCLFVVCFCSLSFFLNYFDVLFDIKEETTPACRARHNSLFFLFPLCHDAYEESNFKRINHFRWQKKCQRSNTKAMFRTHPCKCRSSLQVVVRP